MIKYLFVIISFFYVFLNEDLYSNDQYEYDYEKLTIERTTPPQKFSRSIVTGENLLIRNKPDIKSKVIGKLQIGDIIQVHSVIKTKMRIGNISDYWYEIYFNKTRGYVFGFYITTIESNEIINCEKNGVVFFLRSNKYQKYISNSTRIINTAKKNNGDSYIGNIYTQEVKIINDAVVSISDITPNGCCSSYKTNYTKIFNSDGIEIKKYNNIRCQISYSVKHDYIIIVPDISYDEDKIYDNKIEIINSNGKEIFKTETKQVVDPDQKRHGWLNNIFLLDNNEDLFIWSFPPQLLILNLSSMKIEYFTYGKEINDDEFYWSHSIKQIKNNLILSLLIGIGGEKSQVIYFNIKKKVFEKIINK